VALLAAETVLLVLLRTLVDAFGVAFVVTAFVIAALAVLLVRGVEVRVEADVEQVLLVGACDVCALSFYVLSALPCEMKEL
jgi:hypothetical protein